MMDTYGLRRLKVYSIYQYLVSIIYTILLYRYTVYTSLLYNSHIDLFSHNKLQEPKIGT